MNKFLLLASGSIGSDPIASHNPDEPYRVIWNPIVVRPNPNDYLTEINHPNDHWFFSIKNTDVLTFGNPLGYEPEMLCATPNPMNYAGSPFTNFNLPLPTSASLDNQLDGYAVKDLHNIAYLDRTDLAPKGFQMRFGVLDPIGEFYPMIIYLNKSRTDYVGIQAYANAADGVNIKLVLNIDGEYGESPYIKIEDFTPLGITESVRLVLFDDRAEIQYSDPGTPLATYPLINRLVTRKSAYLGVMRVPAPQPTNHLYFDGLTIYDLS